MLRHTGVNSRKNRHYDALIDGSSTRLGHCSESIPHTEKNRKKQGCRGNQPDCAGPNNPELGKKGRGTQQSTSSTNREHVRCPHNRRRPVAALPIPKEMRPAERDARVARAFNRSESLPRVPLIFRGGDSCFFPIPTLTHAFEIIETSPSSFGNNEK